MHPRVQQQQHLQQQFQQTPQMQQQQSNDLIRQQIRQQLQQKLPSLAQQLPESDRQNLMLDLDNISGGGGIGGLTGLQSFGASGAGGLPSSSDFFNSDSFRATNTSHDNRGGNDEIQPSIISGGATVQAQQQQKRETKVLDLQHVQPFNNNNTSIHSHNVSTQNQTTNFRGSYQQADQDYHDSRNRFGEDTQESNREDRKVGTQELRSDDREQLSPLNYEEFAYQQQLIEELIQENQGLKSQLEQSQTKLSKVEGQLNKTKQLIRELGNIKEELQTLKQSAGNTENVERLSTENEILKSKISDLETRVNTLSRAGDEGRMEDKHRYEKVINTLSDENRQLNEKYLILQQQLLNCETEVSKWKGICQQKDHENEVIHSNWKQLHEEFARAVQENQMLQAQNEELIRKSKVITIENQRVDTKQQQKQLKTESQQPLSQDDPTSQREYISLRNRSFSGDKGQDNWVSDLNNQVEQEFTNRERQDGIHKIIEENLKSKETNQSQQTKSKGQTYGGNGQSEGMPPVQNYQSNINVKNFQPIHISISSPSEQTKELVERCNFLEKSCRELIRTNKILDCENRIAIAQIINLTDPKTQLQNFNTALAFISKSGKIYEKEGTKSVGRNSNRILKNRFTSTNYAENPKKNSMPASTKHQTSLRNLNTLRQCGAPPINQVFQNNNSSFIVQKYQTGLSQSQSSKQMLIDNKIAAAQFASNQKQNGAPTVGTSIHNISSGHQQQQFIASRSDNRANTAGSFRSGQISSNRMDVNHHDSSQQQLQLSQTTSYENQSQQIPAQNNAQSRFGMPISQLVSFENNKQFQQSHSNNSSIQQPLPQQQQPLTTTELDIHLNLLIKEIDEKSGVNLSLKKVSEGFYQLLDRVVYLQLDESNLILIRVQTKDEKTGEPKTMFVDFIDFLIQQGYLNGVQEE